MTEPKIFCLAPKVVFDGNVTQCSWKLALSRCTSESHADCPAVWVSRSALSSGDANIALLCCQLENHCRSKYCSLRQIGFHFLICPFRLPYTPSGYIPHCLCKLSFRITGRSHMPSPTSKVQSYSYMRGLVSTSSGFSFSFTLFCDLWSCQVASI